MIAMRHPGAGRRIDMEFAAAVLFGSVVLYFVKQFERQTW
jgi:hypothetical protein